MWQQGAECPDPSGVGGCVWTRCFLGCSLLSVNPGVCPRGWLAPWNWSVSHRGPLVSLSAGIRDSCASCWGDLRSGGCRDSYLEMPECWADRHPHLGPPPVPSKRRQWGRAPRRVHRAGSAPVKWRENLQAGGRGVHHCSLGLTQPRGGLRGTSLSVNRCVSQSTAHSLGPSAEKALGLSG